MSGRPTPGLFVTPGPGEDRERRSNAPSREPSAKRRRLTQQHEVDIEEEKPVIRAQTVEAERAVEAIVTPDHAEDDPIDFTNDPDEPPEYCLVELNECWPKHEVADRLREEYAAIFDGQYAQARPDTDLKQRMEEIAEKVRAENIAYILSRDKKTWLKVLGRARRELDNEHRQAVQIHESLERPSSRNIIKKGLMATTKERCVKLDKALDKREKLIKEMQKWTGQ